MVPQASSVARTDHAGGAGDQGDLAVEPNPVGHGTFPHCRPVQPGSVVAASG